MTLNQSYPSVGEHESSWADIDLTFNIPDGQTIDVEDITAIKWDRKVTVGVSKNASGGRVMKRTAGSEESTATATFTRSGLRALVAAIKTAAIAAGQVRGDEVAISGISFDLLVQHTPFGLVGVYMAKLEGCRYLGDGNDMKEGSDADLIEVDLSPIKIKTKDPGDAFWTVLR